MIDENELLNPPKLTDKPQVLKEFIARWLEHRGVFVDHKLIREIPWAGEDLARPQWALMDELLSLGFHKSHARGIAIYITQGATRDQEEVRYFCEPVNKFLVF